MSKIKAGKYQHYKGAFYEVIDEVRHSESEEVLVLYKTLYGDFSLWVRPKEMFLQSVTVDAISVPRFKYIGKTNG